MQRAKIIKMEEKNRKKPHLAKEVSPCLVWLLIEQRERKSAGLKHCPQDVQSFPVQSEDSAR